MKNEFDNNLTEPFETDDLGIKASMEGVEPMEGARERMLQNIMAKAAAVQAGAQAAEGVKAVSEETPKAEILSVGAAKEAAKKNTAKKQKNRWKLYVPMLAAAAVILTIGTIFFATIGMEKLTDRKSAADNQEAYDGNHKAPQEAETDMDAKGGYAETGAANLSESRNSEAYAEEPNDAPTGAAAPAITGKPNDGAVSDEVDFPVYTMRPDGESQYSAETPTEADQETGKAFEPTGSPTGAPSDVPANVTDAPDTQAPVSGYEGENDHQPEVHQPDEKSPSTNPREAASPDGWYRLTPERKALSDAVKGLEIVKFSAEDSLEDFVTLSYEGHEYVLLYVGNGRTEIETAEEFRIVTVKTEEADNLTLQKLTSEDNRIWWAEWSLNGTDWFFLRNADGATQEDVEALILTLEENSRAAAN